MKDFNFSEYDIRYSEKGNDSLFLGLVETQTVVNDDGDIVFLYDIRACIAEDTDDATRAFSSEGGTLIGVFPVAEALRSLANSIANPKRVPKINPYLIGKEIIV